MLKRLVRLGLRAILAPSLLYLFGEPLFWLTGRRSRGVVSPADVRSILVVRLDQIGDMVLTLPFLQAIRQSFPAAHITMVVKPNVADIAKICNCIDEVIVFQPQRPIPLAFLFRQVRTIQFAKKWLWHKKYDLAFLPRWDLDTDNATVLAYCSGARRRIGFSEKARPKSEEHINGLDVLLTDAVFSEPEVHEADRPIALLGVLGIAPSAVAAELNPSRELIDVATVLLQNLPRPLVALAPSGGLSPLKQWPSEKFEELARRLAADTSCHILVLGGPDSIELGDKVQAKVGERSTSLCGKTSLGELAAVLAECAVYIGNDSGPTHIAAAVGVPTVALFGASCPHRFSPRGKSVELLWNELPCCPCNRLNHADQCPTCLYPAPLCMETLEVDVVYQAAVRVIEV